MPSGSVPFLSERASGYWPIPTARWSICEPELQVTSPVVVSKMLQVREPPFQSPSSAVATWVSSTQAIASGSRSSVIVPSRVMSPSSSASTSSTVASPAEKEVITSLVATSTTARALFSWRVTTTRLSSGLTFTYSGSASSAAASPGRPAISMRSTSHPSTSPVRSRWASQPVGCWGRSPSSRPSGASSSSRWFSIAM